MKRIKHLAFCPKPKMNIYEVKKGDFVVSTYKSFLRYKNKGSYCIYASEPREGGFFSNITFTVKVMDVETGKFGYWSIFKNVAKLKASGKPMVNKKYLSHTKRIKRVKKR